MKVLLVSANTETINMPVLPLGLGCVARATENAGHTIKIINIMDPEALLKAVRRSIEQFMPDVIGISVRNIDDQDMASPKFMLAPVKSLIAACRKLTRAPIVIGGAGYSIFPVAALSFLGADMGICGQGEKPFVMLLEQLEKGSEPRGIPGLYLPGRTAPGNRGGHDKLDDDAMPLPDIHLFSPFGKGRKDLWIPFQTRRGCPMDCSYCSTAAIEGKPVRRRALSRVVKMLSEYKKAGFHQFFFVDNIFNMPASYCASLCDLMIEKELDIVWRCIVYPWKLNDDLAKKMARAGCVEVALGFESGAADILRNLNKRFVPEDVRQVSRSLRKYNIRQNGFLLLGAPGETHATLTESLEFVESLDLDGMKITCGIRIYPGTEIARRAVGEGVIAADDNLLFPKFYVDQQVRETLKSTTDKWLEKHPEWF